jgi:hypothetical protein
MNNPTMFQRAEAAVVFISAAFAYFYSGFGLLYFILLLFIFDLFMIGYLVNSYVGALLYNVGHSLIIPALLISAYLLNGSSIILGLSLLWIAHIGLDRALGYGLKYGSSFKRTHLGEIGKK